jgi:DNA-binding IclR family transcriptional regulator
MLFEAEFVDWLMRVEAEYREMPGMQLTESQMQRLWGFDGPTCNAVVQTLVTKGVLRETPAHRYVLGTAGR